MAVPNTLKAISDVQPLVVSIIGIIKNGRPSLSEVPALFSLVHELLKLGEDMPLVLPELKGISPEDVGSLTSAGVTLVESILADLGGHLAPVPTPVPAV